MTDEGWSAPALYSAAGTFLPPLTAGADPMTGLLAPAWDEPPPGRESSWGSTTYVGRRRHRPRPAGRDSRAAAPPAPPTVTGSAGVGPTETAQQAATAAAAQATNHGLFAASRSMATASAVSRLTGFLRSSLLVAAIGIGRVGDAYNAANNFPNMVYELLLGGVLSSVLVPLLVRAQDDDADDGVAYTQRLLSVATAALAVMTLLAVACAPLIAGAFVSNHSERTLTTSLATLLLPEIFFYGLGAMFMAVLNIRHSYAPGAWAPVLNNVVMIVTIAVFFALPGPTSLTPSSMTTAQLLVLGIGTTIGIAAQALVLIPALRATGFRWQWRFRARPNEVGRMREVATLASWVLGYVVASQIGVSVVLKVGNAHQAFTVFTNADLLIQMPYGILVVSLLTALMPRLSRAAARGQTAAVLDDLSLGARLSAIALVPITAGLLVLGPDLGVVLFAYHRTTIAGGHLIGTALAVSAFGLFPFALVMLQMRVFYAMRDGRTPTLINVFMVGSKVLIVLVCASTLHTTAHIAESLTIATSASYVVGAIVGHLSLTRRLGRLGFRRVAGTVAAIASASALGALAALGVVVATHAALGYGHGGALAALVFGGLAGLAVLTLVAWRMRIPEIQDTLALLRRR